MRSMMVACLAISLAPVLGQDAVGIKAVSRRVEDGRFVVTISLEIRAGWHTYLSVGRDSASTVTVVGFKAPASVREVGKLNKPIGRPYAKEPGAQILTGRVVFSQEFEMVDNPNGMIEATIRYQACDDQRCMRPTSKTLFVKVPSVERSPFESPARLMSGKRPLNTAARQMYPSPAWYDVDGDGRPELVVGDIFGKLNVYENTNQSGKGDPVWAEPTPLKNSDGKPIKVSNW